LGEALVNRIEKGLLVLELRHGLGGQFNGLVESFERVEKIATVEALGGIGGHPRFRLSDKKPRMSPNTQGITTIEAIQ